MSRLPVVTGREVIRALERVGFYLDHQTGSHARLLHRTRSDLRLTVPSHSKDLPPGTLRSIVRQAGLTVEEFKKLL